MQLARLALFVTQQGALFSSTCWNWPNPLRRPCVKWPTTRDRGYWSGSGLPQVAELRLSEREITRARGPRYTEPS